MFGLLLTLTSFAADVTPDEPIDSPIAVTVDVPLPAPTSRLANPMLPWMDAPQKIGATRTTYWTGAGLVLVGLPTLAVGAFVTDLNGAFGTARGVRQGRGTMLAGTGLVVVGAAVASAGSMRLTTVVNRSGNRLSKAPVYAGWGLFVGSLATVWFPEVSAVLGVGSVFMAKVQLQESHRAMGTRSRMLSWPKRNVQVVPYVLPDGQGAKGSGQQGVALVGRF